MLPRKLAMTRVAGRPRQEAPNYAGQKLSIQISVSARAYCVLLIEFLRTGGRVEQYLDARSVARAYYSRKMTESFMKCTSMPRRTNQDRR